MDKIPKIWCHEFKGVQDVARLEELEIANKLYRNRVNSSNTMSESSKNSILNRWSTD